MQSNSKNTLSRGSSKRPRITKSIKTIVFSTDFQGGKYIPLSLVKCYHPINHLIN